MCTADVSWPSARYLHLKLGVVNFQHPEGTAHFNLRHRLRLLPNNTRQRPVRATHSRIKKLSMNQHITSLIISFSRG